MPELIDALPVHLRLDGSTGRFLADTLAWLESECSLDARQPPLNWLFQSEPETLVTRLYIFNAAQHASAGTSSGALERFRFFKRLLDAAVGVGAKTVIASRLALACNS